MRKIVLAAALVAAVALSGTALAGLGPHDRTPEGSVQGGACAYCHNNTAAAASRGFKSSNVITGSGWYNRPIAQLCYNCHMGYLGGNNVLAAVYDNGSATPATHGFDATASGKALDVVGNLDAGVAASGLPYTTGTDIDCTSCHNVHESNNAPFNMKSGAGTTPAGLQMHEMCVTCHKGRDANTSANSGSDGVTLATHPVRIQIADLTGLTGTVVTKPTTMRAESDAAATGWRTAAGLWQWGPKTEFDGTNELMGCTACHTVHNSTMYEDYTFVDNNASTGGSVANKFSGDDSELCEQCHSPAGDGAYTTVRGASDHPINEFWPGLRVQGAGAGTGADNAYYPAVVMLPAGWLASNGDTAPAGFVNNGPVGYINTGIDADGVATNNGGPHCSSCHEMHGAQDGTKLFQGPAVSADGFCFECHAAADVVPAKHHSTQYTDEAPFVSVLDCGHCHGDGTGSWAAHGGFQNFITVDYAGIVGTQGGYWYYDLCITCHTDVNPTDFSGWGVVANGAIRLGSSHGNPAGTLSHMVGAADNESSFNAVVPNAAVTATVVGGGTEAHLPKLGPGSVFGCESCHNLLTNVGDATDATTTSAGGWKANLLIGALYEDDNAVDHVAGIKQNEGLPTGYTEGVLAGRTSRDLDAGPTSDGFCRVCHTDGATGYVHNPGAHTDGTVPGGTFVYPAPAGAPSSHAAGETGVLTAGNTVADSLTAPTNPRGTGVPTTVFAYPSANTMDCDTCHRPHNADAASTGPGSGPAGGTINAILEPGAMAADLDGSTTVDTLTDPCLICHDPFYTP